MYKPSLFYGVSQVIKCIVYLFFTMLALYAFDFRAGRTAWESDLFNTYENALCVFSLSRRYQAVSCIGITSPRNIEAVPVKFIL